MQKYGLKDAVLKMNCEGCEYAVMRNVSKETLRTFSHIQAHYHGQARLVVGTLRRSGFKVTFRGRGTPFGEYILATRV